MTWDINPLGAEIPPEPEAPKIFSEQYRHSIVQGTYQPETSMISMVQGTPVLVEYYRQRLERDEETSPFDPDDAATYQSYVRIKNLILKQEGEGAFDFDPEKGESSEMCSFFVTYDVAPIIGDVFIAEIKDGRAGLFQIERPPEIINFTANKVYRITVRMVGILQEYWATQLNERVVQELVYSRDSALSGGVGLVTTEDFDVETDLFSWRTSIANWIMRKFWWNPERTIAYSVNGDANIQQGFVYDQYLVKFLCAVIEPDMRSSYPTITQFSTQYGGRDFGMYGTTNIWDVLLSGDFNLLSQIENSDATIIGVDRLVDTRLYGNLRSSKFTYFVTTDPEEYKLYKMYFNMDGYPILRTSVEKKVTYLFTEEFYKGQPQGTFEKLVFDVLKDNIIPRKELLKYCEEEYFKLPKVQQLYYGAILILLIQLSRRFGVPS